MRCPSCGGSLGEMDLLSGACQKCGDILLPDDVDKLRGEMGIAGPAPPEVIAPVIQSEPDEIPDSVDCPGCNTPLMGEDLAKWNAGACPYCSHVNDSSAPPPAPEPAPAPDATPPEPAPAPDATPPEPTGDTIPMIINVGPMVGQVIDVPVGVPVGRKDLFGLLPDPWYEKHLKRVSGEHFEFSRTSNMWASEGPLSPGAAIMDLGSSNGTYVNGTRISGTTATELFPDSFVRTEDINIGGNIQLTPFEVQPGHSYQCHVTHDQSGIRWPVVPGLTTHLGRMAEEGGEMERWAAMADLQLRAMEQDDSILAYLSRRHFAFAWIPSAKTDEVILDVFEGKEEPELVNEGDSKWKINLRKNSFTVES